MMTLDQAMVNVIMARVTGLRLIRPWSRPILELTGRTASETATRVARRVASVGRIAAGRAAAVLAVW